MRIALTLLAVLLVAPSVTAWTVHGDREPSTIQDIEGGYMWLDAGDDAADRVYFDVVAEVGSTGQNPDDALVGADVPVPFASYSAYLGVWHDCNHDGYIGMAAGAILEYDATAAALLGTPVDTQLCPFGSQSNAGDGFVAEFRWIGPQRWNPMPDTLTYVIPHMLDSPLARVWGDLGLPGAPVERSCVVAPLPRGTTASTGAALRFADCLDGASTATTLPSLDAPVSLYGDGARTGLLQTDSGASAVTVWDCARPRDNEVRDPQGPRALDLTDPEPAADGYLLAGSLGPEGIAQFTLFERHADGSAPTMHRELTDAHGAYAYAPGVAPSVDTRGSLMDAVIGVEYGLVEHCDPAAYPGQLLGLAPGPITRQAPGAEADARSQDPAAGRQQNDFAFDFQQFTTSYQEGGTIPQGAIGAPAVADLLGHGMPQDGGLVFVRDAGGSGPGWHATSASATGTKTLTRADTDPLHATHATFYASVGGLPGLSLPHVTAGVYGQEACFAIGRGADRQAGWDCDPDHWSYAARNRYSDAPLGAKVGASYDLRDVDCHEGALEACV